MRPGLDPRTPYLIVNADDLGLSSGVNRAVFAAHDGGIVTSASLMATGAAFDEAVAGARARPRLGVGVHLVLHEERAVLPRERIPDLVGPDGRLLPLRSVLRALLFGALPLEQVEQEYAAQIERARAAGLEPTHLDSHCHLHAFPALGELVHALGARVGVPCARRVEAARWSEFAGAPLARFPLAVLISASHRASPGGRGTGLRTPDRFLGLVQSGVLDAAWVEAAIERLRPGELSELMVHPGDGSDPGEALGDHGPARRRVEFEAVTSPRVRAAIERAGVQLVDYRALG